MLHAVIMAGGSGTRFWPASRNTAPKQLLNLTGDGTMLQNTVRRLEGLCAPEQILIVTNRRLVDESRRQLPELPASGVVGEPCKRDTAPCIGWAAHLVQQHDPDATMIVMPADHVIEPREQFLAAIQYGCDLVEARPDRIVTFGITPTRPAEAFGYIERDRWLDESGPTGPAVCRAGVVRQFREKPDAATAREYLATGRFYWNSGIFIWKAQTILEALRQFEPEMAAHLDCIGDALGSDDADAVLDREFTAINGKSIDYAVMERFAGEICVVEAPFQWDDLGSWQASARRLGVDADGNTCVGRTLAIDSSGCILRTDDQHVVTTIGLRDCIVVHTPDATLVANKNDEESIRLVVAKLKELGWDEHL